MVTFHRIIDIHAPIERVFSFLTDMRNHSRAVPANTHEQLLEGGNAPLVLGSTVKLRAKYGGVYWTMQTKITQYSPPEPENPTSAFFQDTMLKGAFQTWRHDHLLEAIDKQTTRLTDTFNFSAPLGPLGVIAEKVWLTGLMVGMLEHMQAAQKRILEAECGS